jgi:hypothetical protein
VAARDEIAAAEEHALEAALAGDDVASLAREADTLLARFQRAMFWLAVSRLEHRDTITLGLSTPEIAAPLERWVRALLDAAPARGWTITAHLLHVRDPSPVWPESRVWGQPRSASWLQEHLDKEEGGIRNLMLRVRGPGVACLLGLEAGAHRFAGLYKQNPAHLVVRRLSLDVDFDDAAWLRLGSLAAPASAPKGHVERTYTAAADHVMVFDRRIDLPWDEHFARLEEVGLAVIERGLEKETTPGELYPVELADPDEDDDDEKDAKTS